VNDAAPEAEGDAAPPAAPAPAPAPARNVWASQAATGQPRAASTGQPRAASTGRRGRASMPSWDEIVFGARTDDDLA
jgi:hypothetical protein